VQARKKNIQLINDQVGGWTGRVAAKLADLLDDHTFTGKNASML